MLERLTFAEINLSNYRYNLSQIRKLIGSRVKMMAVVKANAYGHGAVELAKMTARFGVDYLGVVCLYEARILRESGIKTPIIILNYTDCDSLEKCLEHKLTLNIMDEKVLSNLDKLARKKNIRTKIHVKIDSGMHRLGLLPKDALKFIPKIENYKNIFLEGLFTHFATADEKDLKFTYEQLDKFKKVLEKLKEKKIHIPLIHAANSAATLRLPQTHFDMVRPGIITYGLAPSSDFTLPFKPKPVLTLKSQIVQIRKINRGESVGYGRQFIAKNETIVGVIPMGYADGLRRGPINWGQVLVQGEKVPILGRVSMDQTSIDLTNIKKVKVGSEVVLIGKQGTNQITADDIADKIGTINYEVTSALASRISRVYLS